MLSPAEDQVFTTIRRQLLILVDDLDPAEVTIDRALSDLGCNSVDRTEIVSMTMEELAIAVPVTEFSRVSDIRSLVGVLARHLP
jgi:polyketide biosynthesis acyl carrier protein